ncbi:MAG: DMT family transporter [Desulfobacula sp.]|uniref:DMT family transporter n=1 Tax=Desulfobacula sp. TaxID=2593537 RepID=UPI001DE30A47|nr:DMT family transporter [Desulfobacula sp.]MBT3485602.1 DMT family transporter [Desulfobacula sp.]MBT3807739.1 DMT family transporter [Desulfobacula sp.]MBT4027456.1 DMT family transporter [Desulfobacula sp.]MBT4197818.1 DMT family transporter [Desulfobacula sp.]
MNLLYLVLVAAVGGVVVTLQGQLIGIINKNVGIAESVFITYGGGGLIIGITMLLLRGGNLSSLQSIPNYVLLTGPLGLVIIAAIGYSVPRLGLVTAFTIMVASQFIIAAVIDHFGFLGADIRQINISRLVGISVMLLGIWLTIKYQFEFTQVLLSNPYRSSVQKLLRILY